MSRQRPASEQRSRTLFGRVLNQYRIWANLTVEELSKQTGILQRSLEYYMTGERHPREEQLDKLCIALCPDDHNRAVLVATALYSRSAGPQEVSSQNSEHALSFGKLLAQYRLLKGLSQRGLSEQIGLTERFVQKLEDGEKRPGEATLKQLRAFFNLAGDEWMVFASAASGLPPPLMVPGLPTPPIHDPEVPSQMRVGHVIGRASDQAKLTHRLIAGRQPAIVALVGLPGMGKTTLASTLAHTIGDRWVDGVLWMSLGKEPKVNENLLRWAYLLGLPASNLAAFTPDQWKVLLHEAVGDRHLLLIVDDAWSFADAERFLVGGPNCATLVTTRFPSVAYEIVGRDMYVLEGMDEAESRQLLQFHAPALATYETPEMAQAERSLLGWAGGLPLALSLLGRHVRAVSGVADSGTQPASNRVYEAIKKTVDALKSPGTRTNITQHDLLTGTVTSLHRVIDASVRWLPSEVERAALNALAVFPPKSETFSLEAALAVSNAPEEVLETLVETGLLERTPQGRFTLHQSVHDCLADPALLRPAKQRAIAYFRAFAERHATDATALSSEMLRLVAALKYAHELDAQDELIRLAVICTPRAQLMGMHSEIAPPLDRAVAVARSAGDQPILIELLRMQARNLDHAARSLEAVDALNEALALSEAHGDGLLRATVLIDLGNVTNKTDRPHAFEDARDYLLRALAIAEQLGKSDLRCDVLYNLSNTAFAQGFSQDALTYALDGLAVARTAGDHVRISGMLSAVGNIMANLGRYADAHTHLSEGIEIARTSGNPVREGYMRINLGVVAINQGSYAEAEDLLKSVLRASELRDDHRHMAFALANLAQVSLARGQTEQAEKQLNEALRQAKSLHRRDRLTDIYLNLGVTALQGSDIAQARTYLLAGQEALGGLHYPEFTALLLCYQGECDLLDPTLPRERTLRSAHDHLDEALAIATHLAHPELIGRVQNALGRMHLQEGNVAAALTAFRVTLATVREHREVIAEAHLGLALAAERGQDLATAREAAQASLDLFTMMGHYRARVARGTLSWLRRTRPDSTGPDHPQEYL